MNIITEDFKMNYFLTVKFEDGETNIYMGKEYFIYCKYLMLNIPVNEPNLTDPLQSIDEAAEKLGWNEDGQLGLDIVFHFYNILCNRRGHRT